MENIRTAVSKSISIVFIMLLTTNAFTQDRNWFVEFIQIDLMKSTQQDFERSFKDAVRTNVRRSSENEIVNYKLKGIEFEITYSSGKCSVERNRSGWDVEKGIITRANVSLAKWIKMSKLKLDLKDFRKFYESEGRSLTYYNDELGIKYGGDQKSIYAIWLYPTNKDFDELYCENILKIR